MKQVSTNFKEIFLKDKEYMNNNVDKTGRNSNTTLIQSWTNLSLQKSQT